MAKRQDYAATNAAWLRSRREQPGVQTLTEGVYYRVITAAPTEGPHPTPSSIITAHYTGRTIDGRVFDSSRGGAPLAIRLRDLIPGWIVALQQMTVGDKWEIYLSASQGYGRYSAPGIPAHSTLIFEIELLGIG
jgi:FKBP-type peptidyl-prolyl cis-trans isomerase